MAMSEEQLLSLLAKLKQDSVLQEKFKTAVDLDAAEALAREAGFDVSQSDWVNYRQTQSLDLRDEDLEGVSGGKGGEAFSKNMKIYDSGDQQCF